MQGKQALGRKPDLVVLDGNPTARPSDIRKIVMVFRNGVGYDVAVLTTAVHGMVGLR